MQFKFEFFRYIIKCSESVNAGKICPIHTILLKSSSVAQLVAMTSQQVNVAGSIPSAAMFAKQGKDLQEGK